MINIRLEQPLLLHHQPQEAAPVGVAQLQQVCLRVEMRQRDQAEESESKSEKWKWRQRKAVKSVKNSKSAGGGGNDTASSGNQTTGSSDDQAGCGNNTGPAKDVGVASEIQREVWSNIDVFKGKGFWTKLLLKNQDAEHRWERCNNFFFQRKTPELMRSILTPHLPSQTTRSGTSVAMEQMPFWTQHHQSSSGWRTQSKAWWQSEKLIRTQTTSFSLTLVSWTRLQRQEGVLSGTQWWSSARWTT